MTFVRPPVAERSCIKPHVCLLSYGILALFFVAIHAGEAKGSDSCVSTIPLRISNLNPFYIPYAPPSAFGVCVLAPNSSELILSSDMATYLHSTTNGRERLLIDGETYKQAIALRGGFHEDWEYLMEITSVYHGPGIFDGFIENWHDAFGLDQGRRDIEPRDRFALSYGVRGRNLVDIRDDIFSLGDLSVGLGHSLGPGILSNEGTTIRGYVGIPTGDHDKLSGSGGFSFSLWIETSGDIYRAEGTRGWQYAASAGVLIAPAPRALSTIGERFVAFGRLGTTWRLWTNVSLTAQVDANSSPYRSSRLAPLDDSVIIVSVGGLLALNENTMLEIALTEDGSPGGAAPDFGLHTAIRWRL